MIPAFLEDWYRTAGSILSFVWFVVFSLVISMVLLALALTILRAAWWLVVG